MKMKEIQLNSIDMRNHGQNNYKGINAQAWAAMSLFLQYLRDPAFLHIHLEAPKFQDFNLVFDNGKKIICESKARKAKFSYENLKVVLDNLSNKGVVGENDEILIICNNINEKIENDVKHLLYFKEASNSFKVKGYSTALIELLPRVKFWVIPQTINENIIYSLFAEVINFWLPQKDIQNIVNSILLQKIYKGSATGSTYSKNEIMQEIDDIKNDVINNSGLYDKERVAVEKQYANIEAALVNPNSVQWAIDQIKALSANYDLLSFVVQRKQRDQINNLELWDNLWQLHSLQIFSFSIFKIFKNNLHTDTNKRYVIDFILKNIGMTKGFYGENFFNEQAVEISKGIITANVDNKYLIKAFEIAKKLIQLHKEESFYVKRNQHQGDLYEKEKAVELIKEIYHRADNHLKDEIARFLLAEFNLVEDEGEFSHYSPPIVFEMLRKWLEERFDNRFMILVNELSEQYDRFYKKFGKKVKFIGWELMGGTTAFSEGNYRITDRHFISYVLEPAIRSYYEKGIDKGWAFIRDHCVIDEKLVKKTMPDFLNRAVYKIVLSRYASDNLDISKEAYQLLKDYIMSRKGIPHKAELIYQELLGMKISDGKKWELIRLTSEKYGIPINPFAEKIVTRLAVNGYQDAKEELRKWFAGNKYYERFSIERDSVETIKGLIESDFAFAFELFNVFIESEYFSSDKYDSFNAYDVASLLYQIIKKDYTKGISLLNRLETRLKLGKNQQILFCYCLFSYLGGDQSDDPVLLNQIYDDIVAPFFASHKNDIVTICERITEPICREAFVEFAIRLAAQNQIGKAISIIEVFIDDPDPYMPGQDINDLENKYNEQKRIEEGEVPSTISSVRGKCGWALMKCSVLAGREYIPQIINIVERLAKDDNWYVNHMVSFALSQLAQNRLTVLPEDRNVLFFGKNKEESLRNSKRVEAIAFNLLSRVAKAPDMVKNALSISILHIFDHIRALNESDALILLHAIMGFSDEVIAKAAPLFVYYAEFRKNDYKDWKWALPGLYDDLEPSKFDDDKFKSILLEAIDKIRPEKRFSFGAQFEYLIRTLSNNKEDAEKLFDIAFHYLDYLSKEYNHEVFRMIYTGIKEGLEKGLYIDKLLELYLKCLRKESEFYHNNLQNIGVNKMYWWPSHYNEDILIFIYQRDKNLFLDAFGIIIDFPKEFYIHDSDKIISLLNEFPKTNKKVRTLVGKLFSRNPGKYYDLRNVWFE